MRYVIFTLCLMTFCISHAQITLGTPLRFSGDAIDAGIDSLALPVEPSSVITVGYASSGAQHWATVSIVGDTLVLSAAVAPAAYRDGMLMRFKLNAGRIARTFVRVLPLPAVLLVRGDGLDPVLGDLQHNGINEIIYADGRFILISARTAECPTNSVRVNANFCMETTRSGPLTFAAAIDYCATRGGRLCTWDEYYAGCTILGDQLQGLHSSWEWLNDMSDHDHSGDQVARTSCTSQRASFPANPSTARCCYSTR